MRPTLSALILVSLGVAAAPAAAKTIPLHGHFFCRKGKPWGPDGYCGYGSAAALHQAWYANVAEINLEYGGGAVTGFSFQALDPVIHNDQDSWGSFDADDKWQPTQDAQDVLDLLPDDAISITVWQAPKVKGWTGVGCPTK